MTIKAAVKIEVGDIVSWGSKYIPGKNGAASAYVPAHTGKVLSFEGRGIVKVEEQRLHKKTGKVLGTDIRRPYLSQLTKL